MYDRGFVVDNMLKHPKLGDIPFSMRIPAEYDGSTPFALYIHCPGWEGWYASGVGANLSSDFVFEASSYVSDMIIITPQPVDRGETTSDMLIALAEWARNAYAIDEARTYLSGYSFGGNAISLAMGKRADLFSRVLHMASRWDGGTDVIVEQRVPLRMVLGDADRYYRVSKAQETYDTIRRKYQAKGLSSAEIDELVVLDVKDDAYFDGSADQHNVGFYYFSHDPDIMGWLFR